MASCDFVTTWDVPALTPGRMQAGLRRTMRDWGNQFLTRLVTTRLSGRTGDMGLNRRTGNLARDFIVKAEETAVGNVVVVKSHGAGDRYAGLQENGGTIRPVNAKWLWIPLPENLTSRGVARQSPRQAIANHGFIHKGVFFGESSLGGGRDIAPLFALKKSVTVRPRMGAGSLFQSMLPLLEIGIAAEMAEAWNG